MLKKPIWEDRKIPGTQGTGSGTQGPGPLSHSVGLSKWDSGPVPVSPGNKIVDWGKIWMKVRDRMSENVRTVGMDTNINEAFSLMKENNIRRLPVVEKGKVTGIITLSDLNQAAPSSATTLSIHELNYLLAKTTIKDILPKKQQLITIGPNNYIETAAKVMRKNRISGLPVIENNQLVGIVTETDIFDAFIDILGVKKTHSRIDLYTADRPGTIASITGMIAEKGKNILNTVVYFDAKKDKYKMIVRIEELDNEDVVAELKKSGYEVESVIVSSEDLL